VSPKLKLTGNKIRKLGLPVQQNSTRNFKFQISQKN
jgi:hypothetical protein